MGDVQIRQARRDDVAEIVRMLGDDFLGRDRERVADLSPYLEAFDAIDQEPNNNLFVAEIEGKVVGTFQLVFMLGLSLGACKRAEIEAVRVDASMRGQGLGKTMFAWAIAHARANSCCVLQLTTNKARKDGQRFYDQLGFEASHVGYKMKL